MGSTIPPTAIENPSSKPKGFTGAKANFVPYMWAFVIDGEPLYASRRVRPWRNNHKGHVADCVGKDLLLLADMESWAE